MESCRGGTTDHIAILRKRSNSFLSSYFSINVCAGRLFLFKSQITSHNVRAQAYLKFTIKKRVICFILCDFFVAHATPHNIKTNVQR